MPGHVGDVLFQGHRLIVLFRGAEGVVLRCFCRPGAFAFGVGDPVVASWEGGDAGLL